MTLVLHLFSGLLISLVVFFFNSPMLRFSVLRGRYLNSLPIT